MKKRLTVFISALMFITMVMQPVSAAKQIPEETNQYVNDYMNVLSQDTINTINEKNDQLENGAEILVVTTDYINTDTEEFSYRLFNQWAVGDAEENNGVLIVLVIEEDKFWITTGTGLNDVLNAGTLSDIIYDYLEEDFDNGNYDEAVLNTFNEIHRIVANKYGLSNEMDNNYIQPENGFSLGNVIIPIIIFIVMMIMIFIIVSALSRPRVRRYTAPRYRNYEPRRFEDPHRTFGRPTGPIMGPRPVRRSTFSSPRSSSSSRSSFGGFSSGRSAGSSISRGIRSSGGGRTRGGGAGRK